MSQAKKTFESETKTAVEAQGGNVHGTFAKNGYAVVRNLVTEAARHFLYGYSLKTAQHGHMRTDDDQVPGTPCRYADPFMESLLELLLPKVESNTGLLLYPTYSYFRVYKQGDVLKRHQDRPACEVSVTLNLGYRSEQPWPIWFEVNGVAQSALLEAGDALLYRGMEVPHWRDRLVGEHSAQVFLHYVDQNGLYKAWRYDKRAGLGTLPLARQVMEKFGPF